MDSRTIVSALTELEAEKDFRVLYACESGSRAWGFASPDSDYDVRFIYVNAPEWYLRVFSGRDVCERDLPGDLDVVGWELRKALQLFAKSNCSLYEWLGSPIVYAEDKAFTAEIRALIADFFNPVRGMHHYLSGARKTFKAYLESEHVNIKKAFYVLRPLLACTWIAEQQTMPPTAFVDLRAGCGLSDAIQDEIDDLLAEKEKASEGDNTVLTIPLREWISSEFDRIGALIETVRAPAKADAALLDSLLRRHVSG